MDKMIKILIDPPHGIDVLGKRSPDGKLLEYKYGREICAEVVKRLVAEGYDAELTTTSEKEPGLTKRVNIVNAICNKLGTKNVCMVSIHVNAAGNCGWYDATYWCAYTSKGQTQGDKLADCLYDAAERVLPPLFPEIPKNKLIKYDMSDGDRDIESNFTVIHKTKCAACLTENFFMDNKANVDWLLSPCGRDAIVRLHVQGIKEYVRKYSQK
jgi:N-acetylmuramoyl-L-alanine amidase|nr:MAG TPA: Cell wall hydrolase autolysin [Caudoviricetes sp.]